METKRINIRVNNI